MMHTSNAPKPPQDSQLLGDGRVDCVETRFGAPKIRGDSVDLAFLDGIRITPLELFDFDVTYISSVEAY
jgi:hypothetical protein